MVELVSVYKLQTGYAYFFLQIISEIGFDEVKVVQVFLRPEVAATATTATK